MCISIYTYIKITLFGSVMFIVLILLPYWLFQSFLLVHSCKQFNSFLLIRTLIVKKCVEESFPIQVFKGGKLWISFILINWNKHISLITLKCHLFDILYWDERDCYLLITMLKFWNGLCKTQFLIHFDAKILVIN